NDHDSLGLFQQRPSQGWGTPAQILDPMHAATTFYRHLLNVPGWQTIPLTRAAQAVQRSAFPGAYAKWEQPATTLVAALTGTELGSACPPPEPLTRTHSHPARPRISVYRKEGPRYARKHRPAAAGQRRQPRLPTLPDHRRRTPRAGHLDHHRRDPAAAKPH